jgi:dihydrolipoamide dehydrogenase
MELGTVYSMLGSKITVIEALDTILAGADPDLARPVMAFAKRAFKEVRLKAKVQKMVTVGKQIKVTSEFQGKSYEELYDRVLVSVGRTPNGKDLGIENTKAQFDERGFIKVDEQMRTSDPKIFAIGDIAGGILLAHKASKEARIAVENICGEGNAVNRDYVIPAVVFTDPEVAWVGLTEGEAKQKGIAVEIAKFPWGASGRALTYDRVDGLTKLIVEPETHRILGVGLVGHGAGELIGEGAVAIEMGATAEDMAAIVHPHPTLSETVMEAAEVFFGHATNVFTKKRAEH